MPKPAQFLRRCFTLVALLSVGASPSGAQTEDAADSARVRWGALAFTPSLALTNVGIDSNVFNEAENPKSDFTATISPQVDLWLRMGRARLSGGSRVETVFFRQYSGQSSLNTVNTGRLDFHLNRFRPYVAGSFLRLTERPGVEIDVRAERQQTEVELGMLVRLTPKLWGTVSERHVTTAYERDAFFGGRGLQQSLNRSAGIRRAGVEYDVTPLTRMTIHVDQELTDFEFSPERDGKGFRLTPGLEFKPHALVSGRLRVGVLRYTPSDPGVAAFTGPTASVDLRYLGASDTEVVGSVDRDLFYSIDTQRYYVQTGVNLGVTRHVTARWSVTTGASSIWLAYSPASFGPDASLSPRPDQVLSASVGLGYRVGNAARTGFAVAYSHRTSDRAWEQYDTLRFFGTLTYGAR
jgi:putative beta-barrel porin BBP2